MNKYQLNHDEEKQIVQSLTGDDTRLLEFIPYILHDLYELGSSPTASLTLLERNNLGINQRWIVLDLCCGKGAQIISVAEKYECSGFGIDLFEPFIEEANLIAKSKGLEGKVNFEMVAIEVAVKIFSGFDLVIYGFDSTSLGDQLESLNKISRCCRKNGLILTELAMKDLTIFEDVVKTSGLKIIDKIIHTTDDVRDTNAADLKRIKRRIDELSKSHQENQRLFDNYIYNQIKECELIENEMTVCTYLIKVNE